MAKALDLLRAREHRRAELRGDSERIFEVRGRDSERVRKSEIAAAGPVRRGRGIRPVTLVTAPRPQFDGGAGRTRPPPHGDGGEGRADARLANW